MPEELSGTADEYGLIDLSGLSLRDLDKVGESSLAAELRRVLGVGTGSDEIAGFTNHVDLW